MLDRGASALHSDLGHSKNVYRTADSGIMNTVHPALKNQRHERTYLRAGSGLFSLEQKPRGGTTARRANDVIYAESLVGWRVTVHGGTPAHLLIFGSLYWI